MAGYSKLTKTEKIQKDESFQEKIDILFNDLDHKTTFQMTKMIHDIMKGLKEIKIEEKENQEVALLKSRIEDLIRFQLKETMHSMTREIKQAWKNCDKTIQTIKEESVRKFQTQEAIIKRTINEHNNILKQLTDTKKRMRETDEKMERINKILDQQDKKIDFFIQNKMKEIEKKTEDQERRFYKLINQQEKKIVILNQNFKETVLQIFQKLSAYQTQQATSEHKQKNFYNELMPYIKSLMKMATFSVGDTSKSKTFPFQMEKRSIERKHNKEDWETQEQIQENRDEAQRTSKFLKGMKNFDREGAEIAQR